MKILPGIVFIFSLLLIGLLLTSTISVGKIIDSFSPCYQKPSNSFPCYGVYDICAIIILSAACIASVAIAAVSLRK